MGDKEQKKRKAGTYQKWSLQEELELLSYLTQTKTQNKQIEKPTAKDYYKAMVADTENNITRDPMLIKNKVAAFRKQYDKATKWINETGQGVKETDGHETFEALKNAKYPFLGSWEYLWGGKKSIHIPHSSSTTQIGPKQNQAKASTSGSGNSAGDTDSEGIVTFVLPYPLEDPYEEKALAQMLDGGVIKDEGSGTIPKGEKEEDEKIEEKTAVDKELNDKEDEDGAMNKQTIKEEKSKKGGKDKEKIPDNVLQAAVNILTPPGKGNKSGAPKTGKEAYEAAVLLREKNQQEKIKIEREKLLQLETTETAKLEFEKMKFTELQQEKQAMRDHEVLMETLRLQKLQAEIELAKLRATSNQ